MLTIVDDKNLGYALGAADYLTKPIDRERLVDRAAAQHRRDLPGAGGGRRPRRPRSCSGGCSSAEGWTVVGGGERARGAGAAARRVPELILLDLMMPEMDGFEFVAELRAPRAVARIPIVVVTAKDLTADDRERLNGHVREDPPEGRLRREQLLAEVRELVAASDQPSGGPGA